MSVERPNLAYLEIIIRFYFGSSGDLTEKCKLKFGTTIRMNVCASLN